MNAVWIALGAVLGLVAGSFLATLAIRWPAGESLGGRSRCDACGVQLRAFALVPLLGYARSGGRCRSCGSSIDWRHPVFELGCACVGAASLATLPGIGGLAGALLGWVLFTIAVLAFERHRIPNALTLPLIVLGIAAGMIAPSSSILDHVLGAGIGWGVIVALRLVRGSGARGPMAGDAGLLGAAGAWLGCQALPLALIVAGGGMAAITGIRRARRVRVPTRPPPRFALLVASVSWPLWLLLAALPAGAPASSAARHGPSHASAERLWSQECTTFVREAPACASR